MSQPSCDPAPDARWWPLKWKQSPYLVADCIAEVTLPGGHVVIYQYDNKFRVSPTNGRATDAETLIDVRCLLLEFAYPGGNHDQ
jgi:hypothetical protein